MRKGVCVVCYTYNHSKYIREALNGFVMQEVDFPYKVIVHDDASTDGTSIIVREYAEKYPDIFIPIIQKENKYSQNIKIFDTIIRPYIDLEYLAFCEGDDYWTDKKKIKKQYDYMCNNPDVSLCVHNTLNITTKGEPLKEINQLDTDTDYSVEEIILARGSGLFHTSSFLLKSKLRLEHPDELRIPKVGDYPMAINAALNGRVHYIGEVMSCYRRNVESSFSVNEWGNDSKLVKLMAEYMAFFDRLDEYTQYKYTKICMKERAYYARAWMLMQYTLPRLFTDKNLRVECKRMPFTERMITYRWLFGHDVRKFLHMEKKHG